LQEAEAGAVRTPEPEPAPAPETAVVTPDVQVSEAHLTIRRAKRGDMEAMARIIATGTQGALDPDLSQMMEAIFSRAYIIALAGEHVVGVAGWQTENLIAGLQDFYVIRTDLWPTAGERMLEMIHQEINNLSCEVSIVFILDIAGPEPVEFFKSQGYEQTDIQSLGYMWEDAAREWQPEDSVILYKKLREQRIMVPM